MKIANKNRIIVSYNGMKSSQNASSSRDKRVGQTAKKRDDVWAVHLPSDSLKNDDLDSSTASQRIMTRTLFVLAEKGGKLPWLKRTPQQLDEHSRNGLKVALSPSVIQYAWKGWQMDEMGFWKIKITSLRAPEENEDPLLTELFYCPYFVLLPNIRRVFLRG